MSHSKEPWKPGNNGVATSNFDGVVFGDDGDHIVYTFSRDDARRVSLCVNYCAGEPDASLELFTAKEQVDLKVKFFNEANTYRDLCGELLKALQDLTCWIEDQPVFLTDAEKFNNAEAAITKAEAVMGENSNG